MNLQSQINSKSNIHSNATKRVIQILYVVGVVNSRVINYCILVVISKQLWREVGGDDGYRSRYFFGAYIHTV